MSNDDTPWQFTFIFRLAIKYKVSLFCVTSEILNNFGDCCISNITADMLEFIDEELALKNGVNSVRY